MAAKKKAPASPRLALKLLAKLPALDEQRRRVYLRAFTDKQCDAWAERSRAAALFGEAERFIGQVHSAMKKPIVEYSAHRFAWLCQLVVELRAAIDADGAESAAEARARRDRTFEQLDDARRRLASALADAALGNDTLTNQVQDRNDQPRGSPRILEQSVSGLLQLATSLRESADGALIADDVGLTAEVLTSVATALDTFTEANQRTFTTDTTRDSPPTNRIEGRVLREMAFALRALRRAKENGAAINLPSPGVILSRMLRA